MSSPASAYILLGTTDTLTAHECESSEEARLFLSFTNLTCLTCVCLLCHDFQLIGSIMNQPWATWLEATGLTPSDLVLILLMLVLFVCVYIELFLLFIVVFSGKKEKNAVQALHVSSQWQAR